MPYIYKITNVINNKIYIGKTLSSIEERWKEHCRDSVKPRVEKRPLYEAMNKYGKENFSIELVEECEEYNINEREIFWIEYYGSFKHGYNATKGGDGRAYIDYELVYRIYQEVGTVQKVKELTGHSLDTISKILEIYGIDKQQRILNGNKAISKPVAQYDLTTGEIIKVYPSAIEAEKEHGNTKHINDVCKGKRKSCKGYGWKYI
jgi:hypothetical protein